MNHDEALQLLPWYVKKRLDESERRAVERHVLNSEECEKEIEMLTQISEAITEVADQEPVYSPQMIAATLARIEDVPQHRPALEARKLSPLERLSQWWGGLFNGSAPARWALAAQAAVIAGLLMTTLTKPALVGVDSDPTYNTVSGAVSVIADVKVLFQPDTTEGALRELLLDLEAEVVGGPNLLGLYALRFKAEDDREAAIQRLRTHPNVVYVERIVAP